MAEQEKRSPGRPLTGDEIRQKVTRSFSPRLLRALKDVTSDQSQFIEEWMWQHPRMIEWSNQQEQR